jgi:hypothetical protein
VAGRISKEAKELARKISAEDRSDIYLYNGPINEAGFGTVVRNLSYKTSRQS